MIPIVYNLPGVLMLALGVACGVVSRMLLEELGCREVVFFWTGGIVGAVVMIAADITFRATRPDSNLPKLIHPTTGGHLYYAPIWAIGAVFGLAFIVYFIGDMQSGR